MQRETWQAPHQAQGLTFESICRRKTALLTIGQAALEDAWEFMDSRPCALFILDESACILSRCGDPQTLAQLAELGFRDGSYCAESIIGSCALSLASMLGQPVKTTGEQHFKQALHGGRLAPRRCLITTGACSAPSRCAV
jgi:transcriptional activator for dhaKLM operon